MAARPREGTWAYDSERVDRVVWFFENFLVHTKGRWARKPFYLTDWQLSDIVDPLFGTVRYDRQHGDWVRAYNQGWIELARGNGKSELMAGIALYLTVYDGEESAEVYGAASDRDQAGFVFNVAKRMVELSQPLSTRLTIRETTKTILDPATNSTYRTIAADAAGNLGQDPHGIVFDEVIAQKNRDLFDALRTGMGKRAQSLMVAATTAGNDPTSFAAAEHEFLERVVEDSELAPSRFVYIRNTPVTADPWDEETWKTANPALGDFLNARTLRDEAAEAQSDPTKENAFRQFRLNQWVSNTTKWMALSMWDATAGLVSRPDLIGRKAIGGLDLASTTDVAALAWFFPADEEEDDAGMRFTGPHRMIWRYWMNEVQFKNLDKRMGGILSPWRRDGWITVTEGDVIDYEQIHADLVKDATDFDVQQIRIDRWNATATMNWLNANDIPNHAVGGGYGEFSPGMKELFRLVKAKELEHGGNPVTRWHLNSTDAKVDPSENIKPVKVTERATTTARVDGIVAAVYAIGEWLDQLGTVEDVPGFISLQDTA